MNDQGVKEEVVVALLTGLVAGAIALLFRQIEKKLDKQEEKSLRNKKTKGSTGR